MKFKIEAICDIGCVRQNNEDMILIGDQLLRDDMIEYTVDPTERNFWIAVSDGMGGHRAGELASEMVLKGMSMVITKLEIGLTFEGVKECLDANIRNIHHQIDQIGLVDPAKHGLGATFTGLLIYEQKGYIINIGDSRLYRLRGGVLACLTNDHSLRNLLNDPSIPQNQLANSFGGGAKKIFFDMDETTLLIGDKILLCTDGLNGELKEPEIEDMLNADMPIAEIINKARENGGNDNISAIKISIV